MNGLIPRDAISYNDITMTQKDGLLPFNSMHFILEPYYGIKYLRNSQIYSIFLKDRQWQIDTYSVKL
jgi:hypothetical protein